MKQLRWLPLAVCLLCPALRGQSRDVLPAPLPGGRVPARWEKVYDRIGTGPWRSSRACRRSTASSSRGRATSSIYLCGVETPHSYIVLDGQTRKATLYLPPRDRRLESAEGRVLSADDVELVKKLTGVDEVLSTAAMKRRPDAAGRRRRRRSTRCSRRPKGQRPEPRRAAHGQRRHQGGLLGRPARRARRTSPSCSRSASRRPR